eukprot:augustus_masked-scaffold_5-processed-gene-6.39-mRNA-1 protein AED:1.00 eAED:1.00 QI:0/0/0/0/1/1/3/0/290
MQCFQSRDLPTPSKEVPGIASRLKHIPKLVSVNVGGLTAFKCRYVQQLSKETEILMLQELHKQGMQRLQILKLVIKLEGKRSLILVNTYAPHCKHGKEFYKKYLKDLKSKLNGINKRRWIGAWGASEIDYVITNRVPAITGFRIPTAISYNLWMKRNLNHLAVSVRININQGRKTGKRTRFQLDYSALGSNRSIQEKVNRELKQILDLNETLTDTYLTLTHSIPTIMKKHLPEINYNLPEHQNSEQTMSLMQHKCANWNNLNSEEKKRITKDLKNLSEGGLQQLAGQNSD